MLRVSKFKKIKKFHFEIIKNIKISEIEYFICQWMLLCNNNKHDIYFLNI